MQTLVHLIYFTPVQVHTVMADPSHRGDGEWVLTLHMSTPLHYADGGLHRSVEVLQSIFSAVEEGVLPP